MPTSVEIDVLAPRFIEIPEHRLHAIACDLVEGWSEGNGSDLHHSQDKPWTVWPFREASKPPVPAGSVMLRLRLNWLEDFAPPDRLTHGMPSGLMLGKYHCDVVDRTYRLAEYRRLWRGPRSRTARLLFHRPTYFRRSGTDALDPDTFLVLNSLAKKWNAYCPPDLRLDPDEVRTLQDVSALVMVDGAIERVNERGRGVRAGFVGEAVIETQGNPAVFSALMRAAEFLGMGAGTTRGYGVVEAQLLGTGD